MGQFSCNGGFQTIVFIENHFGNSRKKTDTHVCSPGGSIGTGLGETQGFEYLMKMLSDFDSGGQCTSKFLHSTSI